MSTPNPGSCTETRMPGEKFDIIGHLPVEMAQNILCYLSSDDFHTAMSVCERWKSVVDNGNYFWKRLCKRECYLEMDSWKRSEFYNNFFKDYNYWQGVYKYNRTVQQNWKTNNYSEHNVEIKIPKGYNYWTFLNDLLVIETRRRRLEYYVYDLKSDKPIICSALKDNYLFDSYEILQSGKYLIAFANKNMIMVWNLENGSIMLEEVWKHVVNIKVNKNLIVLETNKDKLEVCNIETQEIEYEHSGICKDVDIMDGKVVFTSTDDVIHIVKWVDKSLVTLRCCNKGEEHKLMVKNDLLLSFCNRESMDVTLCVWNIVTETKLHSTLLGSLYNIDRASFLNNYLNLTGSSSTNCDRGKYDVIHFWDCANGTLAGTVNNLNYSRLSANQHVMMVSSSSIFKANSLFCVRSGEFLYDLQYTPVPTPDKVAISDTRLFRVQCQWVRDYTILVNVKDYEV